MTAPPSVPKVTAPLAPQTIPQPLHLPRGSVRATLALLLCVTLWYLVLNERAIPDILWESVLLVVAFYFGIRSTAPTTSAAPAVAGGTAEHVRQPFFLPRGSVRVVLLFGFFSIFALEWIKGHSPPDTTILILQILTSYATGFVLSSILLRRARRGARPIRAVTTLRHLVAAASLGIVAAVCGTIVFGAPAWMPAIPDQILAWTVAFYFGSRLAP